MGHRFGNGFDIDHFATLDRRALLRGLGASALVTAGGGLFAGSVWANPVFAAYPFALGIASGDPAADGFVIWTKIAPRPLEPNGGMPRKAVEVDWAVATDERMRQVVQKGRTMAHPELGHSVHVEIGGLEAGRDYFYQFTIGGERSRVGRTRTLPAAGAPLGQLRFAVAGCQRYEDGHFTAWRHIAGERFDFVYHYGDYIYEYRLLRPGERALPVVRVMPGEPDEIYTLNDYRHRYAIYKSDPDLQAAHASAPFLMSYDDHEVDNNWAGDRSEENTPPELFLLRRAAAFQAWYEHMPVRRALMPRGPDILAYRRFAVGDLLSFNLLDTRLFRSDQPCGDGVKPNCREAFNTDRTMLGATQERWLHDGFMETKARWNVLGQQVIVMRNDRDPDPAVFAPSLDKWDGAVAARDRLFAAVEETKLANLVVLTGDIHNNWAGELKKNFDDEKSATLGVEFVATSITSGGDGFDTNDTFRALMTQDPHIKFFNNQRGYMRHVVTPQRWQADYQVLDKVSVPDGRLSTRRSFVVESGSGGLLDA
ncbi:alkaline phosphatase D family protein [Chelatococcus sp. SYSU_G07232]|uniref:Alkaline phosphatase D family protein n=1 Tax=Chelatococcus albus TaxID=3047466 RepID=A0ABT7ACC6_9HYPH|nr:alkaline phosphatase D family protein [Chelatococcus sp. SYSU_G07232]MDJ1157018.1 alkaline phosphatase D family protein [Chelatococcus sp. SYSU_G07232]